MNFKKFIPYILILLIVTLSACSANSDLQNSSFGEPSLPLEEYKEKFLCKNIPTPTAADVFILTQSEDRQYMHYSFSFENFTLDEAKDYIALLEKSVVKNTEKYEVYTENDFPILNYVGKCDDITLSLSQCNTDGGITVNVKKDK